MLEAMRNRAEIIDAAGMVLASWSKNRENATETDYPELGPAVLATLLVEHRPDVAQSALKAWLPLAMQRIPQPSLYGGQAMPLAGLRAITDIYSPTIRLVSKVSGWLEESVFTAQWRYQQIRFEDYDLFRGPAGVLLSERVGRCAATVNKSVIQRLVHLANPQLDGFRIGGYEKDENSAWMQGGINNGLAHGIPGVLAALTLVSEDHQNSLNAIDKITGFLIKEAFTDERGVISWSSRAREDSPPPSGVITRQAYCYGNPGVSWTLWLGGEALKSTEAKEFAVRAFSSCCAAYDFDTYLYGDAEDHQLGICHGAAGTLLIADAFVRHAGLEIAAELRDRLIGFLYDRLDRIVALSEIDNSILTGSMGTLAALLTVMGSSRSWLPCLALK